MNSLKAQTHLAGYELDFYSEHYRYQWKLSEDKIAKSRNKNLIDTVINNTRMSYDSLALHLPFGETVDSGELIISHSGELKVKVISYEIIIHFKNSDVLIESSVNGKIPNEFAQKFNLLKSGDDIVIRKIKCRGPDGTTRDMASLSILIK